MQKMIFFATLMATQLGFAQNSYFKEDFESITNIPSEQLPQGWENTNLLRVVKPQQNTYIAFGNLAANIPRTLKSPILDIRNSVKLTLKLAYSTRQSQIDGEFNVYALENNTRQLLASFSYAEIQPKTPDYDKHPLSETFIKELDLRALQGKNIRLEFEIDSPVVGSIVYLDEVELIENATFSSKEISANAPILTTYPNPVSDFLTIGNAKFPAEVQLFSTDGRRLFDAKVSHSFSIAHLPKGMYFITIKDANGHHHSSKIIKK